MGEILLKPRGLTGPFGIVEALTDTDFRLPEDDIEMPFSLCPARQSLALTLGPSRNRKALKLGTLRQVSDPVDRIVMLACDETGGHTALIGAKSELAAPA